MTNPDKATEIDMNTRTDMVIGLKDGTHVHVQIESEGAVSVPHGAERKPQDQTWSPPLTDVTGVPPGEKPFRTWGTYAMKSARIDEPFVRRPAGRPRGDHYQKDGS